VLSWSPLGDFGALRGRVGVSLSLALSSGLLLHQCWLSMPGYVFLYIAVGSPSPWSPARGFWRCLEFHSNFNSITESLCPVAGQGGVLGWPVTFDWARGHVFSVKGSSRRGVCGAVSYRFAGSLCDALFRRWSSAGRLLPPGVLFWVCGCGQAGFGWLAVSPVLSLYRPGVS